MDKLIPPTDNLYKFLAIGSLIAALFCLTYPIYQNQRMAEFNVRVSIELAKSYSELMPLLKQRQAVEAEIQRFRQYGDKAALDRALEEQAIVQAHWEGNQSAIRELDILKDQTKPAMDIVTSYPGEWIALLCASVVISILSFLWWWWRFQRFQDMQLKAEATMAILRCNRLKAE